MAPKASGRTSARSNASRDQASSPPKRESESPVGRRTRSTRSQSAEPRDQNAGVRKTRRGPRNASREGSVDSVGSNTSVASSRGGRTRKATRAAAVPRGKNLAGYNQSCKLNAISDLSIIAEDRDPEHSAEEELEEDIIRNGSESPRMQSPGATSQMSGSTAVTTHSQTQIKDLDPFTICETLPDLFARSQNILDLLAPANVTEEKVEAIAKELRVNGSKRAKQLKYREETFDPARKHFGKYDYINRSHILKALVGSDEPGDGPFRPDDVLFAANLVTVVRKIMATEKRSSETLTILTRLSQFPEPFVRSFGEDVQYGRSGLLEQSFALGLNIRTQYVISVLENGKDHDNFNPDLVLASTFYTLDERSDSFEEYITNGRLNNILRGEASHSEEQVVQIDDRFNEIRTAFRQSKQAIEAGDVVDFDQLEELFPWSTFLTSLVSWARARYDEISESVAKQGGVEEIRTDLLETMEMFDSQSAVDSRPVANIPKQRQLQYSAPIVSSGSSFAGREQVFQLAKMKRATGVPSSVPTRDAFAPSSLPQPRTAPTPPPQERVSEDPRNNQSPAREDYDDYPVAFDDGDDMVIPASGRPAAEYASSWQAYANEKNKENLAVAKPPKKRSLLDPQPNAQSAAEWSSQEGTPKVSAKRRRSVTEDAESEDEGFESDRRVPDPSRRNNAALSRCAGPVAAAPAPKRVRTQARSVSVEAESSGAARQRQERAEDARQANMRRAVAEDSDEEDPAPTATQVSMVARQEVVRHKIAKKEPSKKRTAWSEADTQKLIEGIEDWGCSWAVLFKLDGWEVERDQVALKDKARNLKVNFLKAGMDLPLNFDNVRLGKKEVNAVRAVNPDYEPEP
ncbi:uncharacterized protein PAC_13835 [Phialocephala subalpina]|uniref:Myb-like domain-containing protein n=1 Tax=Phialocephala subalpina TaxID=576137 RepID=A0A1L7XFZ9_9HELO|nr:uncharacterized protein PAC_13835 [Phialocephala subalpina]